MQPTVRLVDLMGKSSAERGKPQDAAEIAHVMRQWRVVQATAQAQQAARTKPPRDPRSAP